MNTKYYVFGAMSYSPKTLNDFSHTGPSRFYDISDALGDESPRLYSLEEVKKLNCSKTVMNKILKAKPGTWVHIRKDSYMSGFGCYCVPEEAVESLEKIKNMEHELEYLDKTIRSYIPEELLNREEKLREELITEQKKTLFLRLG